MKRYIYNLTFVVDPRREAEFVRWVKSALSVPEFAGGRLLRVAHVPGDPEFTSQAVSISLQQDFDALADAVAFGEGAAENLREAYARWAGGEGLTFPTILEELPME